jgi:hypothetical protein
VDEKRRVEKEEKRMLDILSEEGGHQKRRKNKKLFETHDYIKVNLRRRYFMYENL